MNDLLYRPIDSITEVKDKEGNLKYIIVDGYLFLPTTFKELEEKGLK